MDLRDKENKTPNCNTILQPVFFVTIHAKSSMAYLTLLLASSSSKFSSSLVFGGARRSPKREHPSQDVEDVNMLVAWSKNVIPNFYCSQLMSSCHRIVYKIILSIFSY